MEERAPAPAREPVAEHDAAEMVRLVLEAASQLPGAGHLDLFPVLVLATADRPVGPCQLRMAAGQREAALVPGLEPAHISDLRFDHRVADHPDPPLQVTVQAVVDEGGEPDPDLRGRQSSAGSGSVRGEQVGQEMLQLLAEVGHRPGRAMEDGIAPARSLGRRQLGSAARSA
jgi:hypothetical protein